MDIKISGISSAPINKSNKKKFIKYDLKDVFEDKPFCVEDAVKQLSGIPKGPFDKNTPKFDNIQLKTLESVLTQEPKKWNSVSMLAQK
ncbi:hypothetical protein IJ707_05505, partial [bacterium]|nr:hypothetical protein [bacterium]